jgi:NADPH-dependent 2,4-dienoyl-CoA reductase/sulfur reductase-like enzyme
MGGATRHCSHSPFGMLEFHRVYLGASYGRRLLKEALDAGVDVRTHHTVVELGEGGELLVSSRDGVSHLQGQRIVTATGARETPRSARLVSGDRSIGVLTTGALQAYVAFHGLMPFRRPVIVGSELVSLSAILTCTSHGAKPVAVVEPNARATAAAPLTWLPNLLGIPFHKNAEIVDIKGLHRVESVTIRRGDQLEDIACDGVLFTGQFTPESSLHRLSSLGVDRRSDAPRVDQYGRLANPLYFAAGNVLRAIETGGWAFREGRSVGLAVAQDLALQTSSRTSVQVEFDAPIKLVVPGMISTGDRVLPHAFQHFQLRMTRRAVGRIKLMLDGRTAWVKGGEWLPERRILVPITPSAASASKISFVFEAEA